MSSQTVDRDIRPRVEIIAIFRRKGRAAFRPVFVVHGITEAGTITLHQSSSHGVAIHMARHHSREGWGPVVDSVVYPPGWVA